MLTRAAALVVGLAITSSGLVAANAADSLRGAATDAYDALPVGAATTLPWWQRGKLHLGHSVIRTRNSDIASRNGTTVVAGSEDRRMGGPAQWFVVDGDRLKQLPMQTPTDKPLVSANGHWLAWLEVRAHATEAYRRIERYRVVVYNVERQRVAASFRDRRRVAWEDGINGIWLRTLSNKGRLVLSQGKDGLKVLSPNGRLARFDGPGGPSDDLDGWPRGTTVFRPKQDVSVYGLVERDGSFDRAGRLAGSFWGLWSADGSAYAYEDFDTEDQTFWTRPLDDEPVQLAVPDDAGEFRIVGWESEDAVVLWHFDDYSSEPASRLVRCFATTGACERVPGGPRAGAPATMPSR